MKDGILQPRAKDDICNSARRPLLSITAVQTLQSVSFFVLNGPEWNGQMEKETFSNPMALPTLTGTWMESAVTSMTFSRR